MVKPEGLSVMDKESTDALKQVIFTTLPTLQRLDGLHKHVKMENAGEQLLGSGLQGSFLHGAPCSNQGCDGDAQSKFQCEKCRLLSYCSHKCKLHHAKAHALGSCKGGGDKESMGGGAVEMSIFLWGNVPAVSLINPDKQLIPPEHLQLCFAASGDLRDFLHTMAKIPDDYTGSLKVVINDINPEVAARNSVILELLRVHGEAGIEAAIAVWYSFCMTDAQNLAVKLAVYDALERCGYWFRSAVGLLHNGSLSDGEGPALVAPFTTNTNSTLTMQMDDVTLGSIATVYLLTHVSAEDIHKARKEKLRMFNNSCEPFSYETGVLLPRACVSGSGGLCGNNFLLGDTGLWTQMSVADPMLGWDFAEVMKSAREHGVASDDCYGALFFHVKKLLTRFVRLVQRNKVDIVISGLDAREMAKRFLVEGETFDAIGTSNISDANYIGFEHLFGDFGPLLRRNGTLFMHSMNWFQHSTQNSAVTMERLFEAMRAALGFKDVKTISKKVQKKVDELVKRSGRRVRERTIFCYPSKAAYCMRTDLAFEKWMREHGVYASAKKAGLVARKTNKVVPPRMFVPLHCPPEACPLDFAGSLEELEHQLNSLNSFMDRYVEWELK